MEAEVEFLSNFSVDNLLEAEYFAIPSTWPT